MTEPEIAYKVLNRRNSASPIILIGELQESLGPDGYGLALDRGWIEPNYDSGEISISNREEVLEELRKMAEKHKVEPVTESTKSPNTIFRMFSNMPPPRTIVESSHRVYEERPDEYDVGENVTVAEEGEAVDAVVKARNPDGSYTLSFGATKPKSDRPYKKEELKRKEAAPGSPPDAAKPPAVVR